jgi:PBP1b-binding outer membrane lipoprotein LpoB
MKKLTAILTMLTLIFIVGCKKEEPKKVDEAAKPKTEETTPAEKPMEGPKDPAEK